MCQLILDVRHLILDTYIQSYIYILSAMFEWDKSKAKKNQLKHGMAFADTFAVFEDPNAVTLENLRSDEQRYTTLEWMLLAVYWW